MEWKMWMYSSDVKEVDMVPLSRCVDKRKVESRKTPRCFRGTYMVALTKIQNSKGGVGYRVGTAIFKVATKQTNNKQTNKKPHKKQQQKKSQVKMF